MRSTRNAKNKATNSLKDIPTCELVEELVNREGVKRHFVDVEDFYNIQVNDVKLDTFDARGPVILLEVID